MDPTVEGRKTVDNEDSIRHLISSNQARSVVLLGVPIVALVMEGQERLCLAQISNTLLKKFSYNEIHNRRVALGITCVQCTPVQLEVLRRAGAMPISSRRCGMITKREAERLCKSFLADSPPPKLPDDFEFVVAHKCAWGCRGSFLPSRYNSSRAKCLRCHSCDQYFSPNKFIFHSHRTGDSTYVQPDAANFNSWRRHLHLVDLTIPEGQLHAWEDVKAMFNGGSRKRVGGESSGSGHRQLQPKFDGGRGRRTAVVPPPPPRPIAPTSWSEMPPGSFLHLNNVIESAMTNPFCWGFPPPSSFLQLQPQPKAIAAPQQQFSDGQMSEMSSAPSAFRPVEVSLDLSLKRTAGRPSVKQDGNNDSNCSKANHN